MAFCFYAIALIGFYIFMLRARRFDLFTVAYGAALVYFSPGFFGFVRYPPRMGLDMVVPLASETYLVFCGVLASITLSGLAFEHVRPRPPRFWVGRTRHAAVLALASTTLGFGIALLTSGSALFNSDKDVVLAQLDRWYLLATSSLVLAAAFCFARRSWLLFAIAICGVVFDLYVGFRDSAAFTAISLLLLSISGDRKRRLLVEHWKALVPVVLMLPVLLIYKAVAFLIKSGELGRVFASLGDSEVYVGAVMYSEPFGVQAILNEIVVTHFHVGPDHFATAINNFLLFSGNLGLENRSFNDLFQPALFPYADYGMANNIWAEMLSSGGWPLLFAFMFAFNVLLAIGSRMMRTDHPELRALWAVLGTEWAFYIHRNDLAYQLTVEKRTLLVGAGCIFVSALLVSASQAPRAGPPADSAI